MTKEPIRLTEEEVQAELDRLDQIESSHLKLSHRIERSSLDAYAVLLDLQTESAKRMNKKMLE